VVCLVVLVDRAGSKFKCSTKRGFGGVTRYLVDDGINWTFLDIAHPISEGAKNLTIYFKAKYKGRLKIGLYSKIESFRNMLTYKLSREQNVEASAGKNKVGLLTWLRFNI